MSNTDPFTAGILLQGLGERENQVQSNQGIHTSNQYIHKTNKSEIHKNNQETQKNKTLQDVIHTKDSIASEKYEYLVSVDDINEQDTEYQSNIRNQAGIKDSFFSKHYNDGYRLGIEIGNNDQLQSGFNDGYNDAICVAVRIASVKAKSDSAYDISIKHRA